MNAYSMMSNGVVYRVIREGTQRLRECRVLAKIKNIDFINMGA